MRLSVSNVHGFYPAIKRYGKVLSPVSENNTGNSKYHFIWLVWFCSLRLLAALFQGSQFLCRCSWSHIFRGEALHITGCFQNHSYQLLTQFINKSLHLYDQTNILFPVSIPGSIGLCFQTSRHIRDRGIFVYTIRKGSQNDDISDNPGLQCGIIS